MLSFTLEGVDNAPGLDTRALLLDTLAQQHPTWVTGPQRYIKKIQHFSFAYRPERTLLTLGDHTDPHFKVFFVYDRLRITRYLTNPLFHESELVTVRGFSAVELAAYLSEVCDLNINEHDFLIEPAGITYTGGYERPNWRLQARPDSPFWFDNQILWLHTPMVAPQ